MERDPESVDAPRMRLTVSLDRGSGGAGGRGDAAPDARGVADPSSRPGPVASSGRLDDDDLEFDIDDDACDARDSAVALVVPDDPDDPAARLFHASPPAAHARAHPSDPDASAPAVGSGRDDPADVDPALKLDFRSPHFDPLLALRQRPPLTTPRDVRPLDNVRKFRPFLPEGDPHRINRESSTRRRFPRRRRRASARQRTRGEVQRSVRTRENAPTHARANTRRRQGARRSPLASRSRARARRSRRRRTTLDDASGVRGEARATVVAFDRHLNMVLRDVREKYTVRLRFGREPQ